jgi:hypothetical protein
MFGVEAKKFFNFNDGMKDEAFRQQQRAVDNEKKREAFKTQIQQKLQELKQINLQSRTIDKITFNKPKSNFVPAKKVQI